MSTTPASTAPAVKVKKAASPIVTAYLLAYNLIAAASWAYVLSLIVRHFAVEKQGIDTLYTAIDMPLYFAQSLAVLEIFHSLFGLVSSPVFTTVVQVFSRLQLVWGIFYIVPDSRTQIGFVLATTVRLKQHRERQCKHMRGNRWVCVWWHHRQRQTFQTTVSGTDVASSANSSFLRHVVARRRTA